MVKKKAKKPAKKSIKKKVVKKKPAAKKKPVAKKKLARKPVKKLTVKKKPAVKKKLLAARKKPTAQKRPALKKYEGILVGEITHYFPHVNAAVVKLKVPLSVGEMIKVKGHTTDFTQKVTSIQIDRTALPQAKPGDEIGLQVGSRVRRGDVVTKL
ncbi:MAG TPA: hypothetical protein P5110_09050 [Candidatus Omnitrophota bacterium]|nr:hypothetical protein [Candidatus Omnitrophota bacterium]HRZ15639.1 hypothetical protein [Candidatus Omnitrophota bacterium]